jgi:hypothetical protein
MAALPVALATYASGVHGYLSDDDLRRFGVSEWQRDRLVRAGMLITVFRCVYRIAAYPETFEGRCRAICLAAPTAVITGRAAGRLWGLRLMGRITQIEVRAPHYCNTLKAPWVRLRRCNVMEGVDIVERADGIRVVSPPRLAFDLAANLTPLELESVIEQILDRRYCIMTTLYEMGRRLYHPARPGATTFARVLASRPEWLKPVDSNHELVLYDALRTAGVTGMVRQHKLSLPTGWDIHADVAVPTLRWAIPIDHVTWHGGRIDTQRDKHNDRLAGTIGWRVDRVTDEDIAERLDETVAELLIIRRDLIAFVSLGGARRN